MRDGIRIKLIIKNNYIFPKYIYFYNYFFYLINNFVIAFPQRRNIEKTLKFNIVAMLKFNIVTTLPYLVGLLYQTLNFHNWHLFCVLFLDVIILCQQLPESLDKASFYSASLEEVYHVLL